jgi:putative transposase
VEGMARPLRVQFEDAIYHLCARGNARQQIFRDERDRARFLSLLSESAYRFEAAILCFVLMGNHFHLVAQSHRPNLRRWMHWLLVYYRVYLIGGVAGPGIYSRGATRVSWFKRAIICWGLSGYVHLNPVRGVSLGRGTSPNGANGCAPLVEQLSRLCGLERTLSLCGRGDDLGRVARA